MEKHSPLFSTAFSAFWLSPPVSAAEVYAHLTGSVWQNHLAAAPFDYDLRSRHAALLGGQGGYLCTKEEELAEIAAFMKGWT